MAGVPASATTIAAAAALTGTRTIASVTRTDWTRLADQLVEGLALTVAPIAITFTAEAPSGIPAFDRPMSAPTNDGRSGRVPASCVFWMHATTATFTTAPEDHGNSSVGRVVHGLATLDDVAGNADVDALLGAGWVTEAAVADIAVVRGEPGAITYGPLRETSLDPDVVLLRIDGRQLMVMSDAVPSLRVEGKPQCHVIARAKEDGGVAVSVGCALSRARTGMAASEMTCAIPASRLAEVVEQVQRASGVNTVVADYALTDARRFDDGSATSPGRPPGQRL